MTPEKGPGSRRDKNGAPAEAQRSGFGGERTSSEMNELCRLWQSERYGACEDEGYAPYDPCGNRKVTEKRGAEEVFPSSVPERKAQKT